MLDVAHHGGSVERSGRGFPICSILARIALGCALLAGLGWISAADAVVLYGCTGAHGEAVYSNSKTGYRDCRVISTYGASVSRRQRPSRVSLTQVSGTVATTAHGVLAEDMKTTSLIRVEGTVETSAQAIGDQQSQHTSLTSVSGSVVSFPATSGRELMLSSKTDESKLGKPASLMALKPIAATSSVVRTYYYKVVHADGSVYLGDGRPQLQKGDSISRNFVDYIPTCVACNLHSPIRWNSVSLNVTAYADVIRAASAEYGVDEAFLRAIIHAESAFNPRAMSIKGAQGLMQLMPSTASDMGVLDAFNTDQNIRGGARYLSLLLHDFNGSEQLAAAAYNAGPGAVQRYSGVPPYAETQVYVVRVGTLRKRYGAALHPPLASSGSN
jgi:soluble lytic murein transglycosylase-like protein